MLAPSWRSFLKRSRAACLATASTGTKSKTWLKRRIKSGKLLAKLIKTLRLPTGGVVPISTGAPPFWAFTL